MMMAAEAALVVQGGDSPDYETSHNDVNDCHPDHQSDDDHVIATATATTATAITATPKGQV